MKTKLIKPSRKSIFFVLLKESLTKKLQETFQLTSMWLIFARFLRSSLAAFFSALFTFTLLGMAGVAGLYVYFSPQLPDSQSLKQINLQVPLRIYSRENQLIAEYGSQRSRPVEFAEIPVKLRQAFIAIEDSRYYEHPGFDVIGVARALVNVISTGSASQGASTITMQLARNAFLDNEKTLSRKLRETLLAIRIEQSFSKDEILELYLNKIYLGKRAYGIAAAAETYYGKENLHDLSLAQMAMIAGLPKAPSRYNPIANESRSMLRRNYILQRMHELGFITTQEYDQAIAEPNTAKVHKPDIQTHAPYLAEMVRQEIINRYADKAYKQGYHVYTTIDSTMQADAIQALRETLDAYDKRHGYRGPEAHLDLDSFTTQEAWLDKLAAHTPIGDLQAGVVINANAQKAQVQLIDESLIELALEDVKWARPFIDADRRGPAPRKVSDVLSRGDIVRVRQIEIENDTDGDETTIMKWTLSQIPAVGGALVLMDPDNGALRAIMGGYDFYHSKFNRATQAMRQPGSSFKPLVYSAALSRGFRATSVVNDAPITIPGSDWQPKNFGGRYIGPTTLEEALAKSRNLVSIRVLRDTGIDHTINYARRFGFEKKHLPRNLTLALGTGLTTPLQMATVYSTFANGGFKVNSHFIQRIEDREGNVLYDASLSTQYACGDVEQCQLPRKQVASTSKSESDTNINIETETSAQAAPKVVPAAPRIMDSTTHYQIVNMLQGVTRFGTAAKTRRVLKREDLAGKTGTTNEQRDSWFAGFTPEYVAIAWSGFDDMSKLGEGETSTRIAVPMWINLMQRVLKDQPEAEWKKPEKLQTVRIDADTGLLATAESTNIIEEGKVLQRAAAPRQRTGQNFEFQESIISPQQSQTPYANQAQPDAPSRPAERVEIPEQIF